MENVNSTNCKDIYFFLKCSFYFYEVFFNFRNAKSKYNTYVYMR